MLSIASQSGTVVGALLAYMETVLSLPAERPQSGSH